MDDIAIRVEGLGKRYRIGPREPYRALRDTLSEIMHAPLRRIRSGARGPGLPGARGTQRNEWFWALQDLSFELKKGEVVGIIGRNGAGKSTLLKILSRITLPTEGRAEIHGRVGSLLEVGTGFHPELTGRENVYLNGSIQGMRKPEIDRKFDEIVAFAEVEKFIETPVKHYSSGMYMRLAFSVAAHLEAEILLVDEVLAVGDIAFQKKCLGKMGDMSKDGRTVLLVSHQLNQVRRMSTRCFWIERGQLQKSGPPSAVITDYESATTSPSNQLGKHDQRESRDAGSRFVSWDIVEPKSDPSNYLTTTGPFTLRFLLQLKTSLQRGHHGIALWSTDGQLMWAWAAENLRAGEGTHELAYSLPCLPLRPGAYRWQVSLYDDRALLDNWF